MSEYHQLVITLVIIINRNIHANDIVSVHEYRFVTHYKLFQMRIIIFGLVFQDVHVWISDIQFVLPSDQEVVLLWIFFADFDNEESQFFFEFVCTNVVELFFSIIDYHLN